MRFNPATVSSIAASTRLDLLALPYPHAMRPPSSMTRILLPACLAASMNRSISAPSQIVRVGVRGIDRRVVHDARAHPECAQCRVHAIAIACAVAFGQRQRPAGRYPGSEQTQQKAERVLDEVVSDDQRPSRERIVRHGRILPDQRHGADDLVQLGVAIPSQPEGKQFHYLPRERFLVAGRIVDQYLGMSVSLDEVTERVRFARAMRAPAKTDALEGLSAAAAQHHKVVPSPLQLEALRARNLVQLTPEVLGTNRPRQTLPARSRLGENGSICCHGGRRCLVQAFASSVIRSRSST
jgi:hypothetical protein